MIMPRSVASIDHEQQPREYRLRDLLSRRPVRDPAADRRCAGPSPLGDRLVGRDARSAGRCSSCPTARFAAEAEKRMGGFLGTARPARPPLELPARLPPRRDDHRPSGSLWSATPRTASTRSPARASISASATSRLWSRCWSRASASASTSAIAQLLARYERWRSLDTFMVAAATDGLTRLFGIPGRTASAVRRFGLSAVQRLPPLKDASWPRRAAKAARCRKLLQGLTV